MKKEKYIKKSLEDWQDKVKSIARKFGIDNVEKIICLYFTAILDDRINEYIQSIQAESQFKFDLNKDDSISIMGVTNKSGGKFVFLERIDKHYYEQLGYFHEVNEFPKWDFEQFEHDYEYYSNIYDKLGGKV